MVEINKNNLDVDDWALYVVIVFNDIDKLCVCVCVYQF